MELLHRFYRLLYKVHVVVIKTIFLIKLAVDGIYRLPPVDVVVRCKILHGEDLGIIVL